MDHNHHPLQMSGDIEKQSNRPKLDSIKLALPSPSSHESATFLKMRILAVLVLSLGLATLGYSYPRLSIKYASRDDQRLLTAPSSTVSATFSADRSWPKAYTAPSSFPTSAFDSYYFLPTGLTAEPRPAVTNVDSHTYFPDKVGNPSVYPPGPSPTDAVFPKPSSTVQPSRDYPALIESKIVSIIGGTGAACQKCISALKLAQQLARNDPTSGPAIMIYLCKKYKFKSDSDCQQTYRPEVLGSSYIQVLSYADMDSQNSTDAQYICSLLLGSQSKCHLPSPRHLDTNFLNQWFRGKTSPMPKKQKTKGPGKPLKRGGNLRVLHMSDIHVDPRFFVGGEAACTNGRCCRSDSYNATRSDGHFSLGTLPLANVSEPSVYWGNYKCDSPWSLVLATFQSFKQISPQIDMTVFTGDMLVHDLPQYIFKDLVYYTQQSLYDLMKKHLGDGPVFGAIGNHDSAPSDFASPNDLPDNRGEQFSWSYDHLSRLWEAEGWFDHQEAKQVGKHYGGYSVSPRQGLRIITINTDFWYRSNVFNLIHTQNPDYSGTLRFLTDELFKAEEKGERVWIVGHVLTGWDGTNPLDNPTNLFYQVVDRFAPQTIAHIFFGHTHEDQFNIFYSNNGTLKATRNAVAVSLMGPSITLGSNVNPSFRIMEIDPVTYEIHDYHQYYAYVPSFPLLPETSHGPVFELLYSARDAYSNLTASYQASTYSADVVLEKGFWPKNAPLNATFWSAVTDEMEARPQLVQQFTVYQGRNSPRSPVCTDDLCVRAKICYMRSGSAIIGKQCPQGFGSVQS